MAPVVGGVGSSDNVWEDVAYIACQVSHFLSSTRHSPLRSPPATPPPPPAAQIEERNLLSVGYKNVIGARRASWRILR